MAACILTACLGTSAAQDDLELQFQLPPSFLAPGHQKDCSQSSIVPGVCFPTDFFRSHASAYGAKLSPTSVVQAAPIPFLETRGGLKSVDTFTNLSVASAASVATGAPEQSEASELENESSGSVAVLDRGWHARLPHSLKDEAESSSPISNSNGHSVVRVGWSGFEDDFLDLDSLSLPTDSQAEPNKVPIFAETQVAQASGWSDESYPIAQVSSFDDGTGPSLLIPSQASGEEKENELFSSLQQVTFFQAGKTLPNSDGMSSLEEQFGTDHHWSNRTWSSMRPERNVYSFRHNPLYFEDPNLERCGRGSGVFTEAHSVVRFAGRIPLLPYMMTVEPACCTVPAKPDCPSCQKFGLDGYIPNPSELDATGCAVQAAATIGLIFLIP